MLIAFTSSLGAFSGLAKAQTAATIKLSGTNVCTDVNAESKTPGVAVITWACNGGNNQNWTPTPTGTQYTFVNLNSNLCLDVAGISMTAGAAVDQWTCNGQPNQRFTLNSQNNGFAIIAVHSGLCLAATSLTAQSPQITQQACSGAAVQTWQISGMSATTLPSKWSAPVTLPLVPNCHTQTASTTAFAPPLTPGYLLDATSRRGGPRVAITRRPSAARSGTASIRPTSCCASPCLATTFPTPSAPRFGVSLPTTNAETQ
ncbi:MAG TPA: RICIN domain-containing protein [Paraburkholderia sp.]|nr:RICIN domain-containing protein [Paraburkholderia sp.]